MLALSKLIIPTEICLKPNGDITFRSPEFMTQEYYDYIFCSLDMRRDGHQIYIDYYCEDDTYLSENLSMEIIASGDLTKERFGTIQERALKELSFFLDNPVQEMSELIDEL